MHREGVQIKKWIFDAVEHIKRFEGLSQSLDPAVANEWLKDSLGAADFPVQLDIARQFYRRGQEEQSHSVLDSIIVELRNPDHLCQVGILLRQMKCVVRAEEIFNSILTLDPTHKDAAFALAGLLRESGGRIKAASEVIVKFEASSKCDLETTLQCATFLNQCHRYSAAMDVCDRAIERGLQDIRLHFLAAEIKAVIGKFDAARVNLSSALALGADTNLFFIPHALSDLQRYKDATHSDFKLFESQLQRNDLRPTARASLLFAKGKAADDIGDFKEATKAWREANSFAKLDLIWSEKAFSLLIDRQISAQKFTTQIPPVGGFVPVFIVGMLRSGTSLVANLLARDEGVRNRGETNLIPTLWSLNQEKINEVDVVFSASRFCHTHLVQDDPPAHIYIDKNPLNFRYINFIAAMFPNARIIYCKRNMRDTAISIWSRMFARQDNEFSYDLNHIAAYAKSCSRLMQHWQANLDIPIFNLDYENLVSEPDIVMKSLRAFLNLDEEVGRKLGALPSDTSIATSSRWQARQPLYDYAVGRWQNYAPHMPELFELFPGSTE